MTAVQRVQGTNMLESQRRSINGRNSHQVGVLGIYDLQGPSYGRTELLVAGMRLLLLMTRSDVVLHVGVARRRRPRSGRDWILLWVR